MYYETALHWAFQVQREGEVIDSDVAFPLSWSSEDVPSSKMYVSASALLMLMDRKMEELW